MTKTKIEIKSIWGTILFSFESEGNDIKTTLEKAVKGRADLRRADLREANLRRADLRGADLREANLWRADLWRADLREANLWRADLWGANLREANLRRADLRGADLREANLWRADLREANLREANLWGANLREANLWRADLRGADLRGADLREANLCEAKNLPPIYHDNLNILRSQKGKLTAYKYVTSEMESPQNDNKLLYKIGMIVKEKDFCSDDRILCDKGLSVATLEWCLRERDTYQPVIEVEFDAKDIVSIPYNTDGKFRVKKLKVIRKLTKREIDKALNRKYD